MPLGLLFLSKAYFKMEIKICDICSGPVNDPKKRLTLILKGTRDDGNHWYGVSIANIDLCDPCHEKIFQYKFWLKRVRDTILNSSEIPSSSQ